MNNEQDFEILAVLCPITPREQALAAPECETSVALHADCTLACSCSTMEPEDTEPHAHWDTDADTLAAIRVAEQAYQETSR